MTVIKMIGYGKNNKNEFAFGTTRTGKTGAALSIFLCVIMIFLSACTGSTEPSESTEQTVQELTGAEITESGTSENVGTTADTEPAIPEGASMLTDYASFSGGGSDWAPAVSEALKSSSTVYIPAGRYNMSSVKLSSGQMLCGAGDETVIIQNNDADRLFDISGSRSKKADLATDKEDFSDSFVIKSDIGLKPGDTVFLLGQRNAMILEDDGIEWCLGRSYAAGTACFYSEFLTVESVSGTGSGEKVKTTAPSLFPFYYADGTRESDPLRPTVSTATDWPYRRAATTCWLMNMAENVTVANLSVENAHGTCIYALWTKNLKITGLKVRTSETEAADTQTTFVRMLECLDSVVASCDFSVPVKPDITKIKADGMNSFGSYNLLWILSSSRCGFDGCSVDFGTHCIALGKKHGEGVNTGCFIKNCDIGNAVWSGIFVAQGSYDTEISGNRVENCPLGIMTAGRKTLISGNVIKGPGRATEDYQYMKQSEGGTSGIVLTEGYSFDAVIVGNTVENVDTGLLIRDGYEKTNIFEVSEVTFADNTVRYIKRSSYVWKNGYNKSGIKPELTPDKNDVSRQ